MSTDTTVLDGLDFPAPSLAVPDDVADLLFREARTAHHFTDDEVTDEEVAAVYELVKWGPTAINTVPLRLLVVRTPEARARLAAHMNEGNRERVLGAPLTIVVAADTRFHKHIPVLMPPYAAMAESLEPNEPAREQMARTNATLQAGYLLVGLRAAGLAVGPMTGMDAPAIDEEFFTENGWKTLMVFNVGRTEGTGAAFPRGARLTYEQAALTV